MDPLMLQVAMALKFQRNTRKPRSLKIAWPDYKLKTSRPSLGTVLKLASHDRLLQFPLLTVLRILITGITKRNIGSKKELNIALASQKTCLPQEQLFIHENACNGHAKKLCNRLFTTLQAQVEHLKETTSHKHTSKLSDRGLPATILQIVRTTKLSTKKEP
ncbi:hypothetical protein Csa_000129 [Cucumis sativus]|uniref:Uncharacterized protein n=1 Tax=Cucumis sativus TaxID=3659 RepID=A0A0A0KPU2_CUCSA|nr:hypothetical protein Csa_000129 [Cucumis sativus]